MKRELMGVLAEIDARRAELQSTLDHGGLRAPGAWRSSMLTCISEGNYLRNRILTALGGEDQEAINEASLAAHDQRQAEAEIQRLRNELAQERATWCDKPEDRLYHAADQTWWARRGGRPVGAPPPDEVVVLARALLEFSRDAVGSAAFSTAERVVSAVKALQPKEG